MRQTPTLYFYVLFTLPLSLSVSLFFLCAYIVDKKKTQMKRSPASSCSSSSSSSCVGSVIPHQSEKPKAKAKRAKKNHNPEKCQNGNSAGSARRSSIYRGVTRWSFYLFYICFSLMGFHLHVSYSSFCIKKHRHRWTGRYEAHLWDKSSWNSIQNKKGRQGNFALFFFFLMKNYNYINNERTKEICSLFF